jgi:hypothetical protein
MQSLVPIRCAKASAERQSSHTPDNSHIKPQPSVRVCSVLALPFIRASDVMMSSTHAIARGSTVATGTESLKRSCGRAAHLRRC